MVHAESEEGRGGADKERRGGGVGVGDMLRLHPL